MPNSLRPILHNRIHILTTSSSLLSTYIENWCVLKYFQYFYLDCLNEKNLLFRIAVLYSVKFSHIRGTYENIIQLVSDL